VVLYSATGNAWINPRVVTISFMPDGTSLGGATSNLISTFNNNPNLAGRWQQQFLLAAQTWANQTNINFVVVPDNGAPLGGGNDQEGDPGMGDIRIGGYNFGTSTLAWSYQPPPVNNFSLAGDIEFNTGMTFNIGSTYDLFTVAAHELGHALGLGQSSGLATSVMYPTYTGRKISLSADDIAGMRSIYGGARAPDVYGGLNSTFATAANLDSLIDANALTGLAHNLDLAMIGQSEFFSVDAPAGTNGPMEVSVRSLGLSLLSPKVMVYAADAATVAGSANGAGQDGTTLTVNIPDAVAGRRYYIRVQGADSSVFGTGDYALGLSFNGTAPPAEPSPIITYPNGTPLHSGGGSAQQGNANGGLVGAPPTIVGIGPDTGASSTDGITDANRITLSGVAPQGETITVYTHGIPIGTTMADVNGNWTFDNTGTALADGTYVFTATATDPDGNVSAPSLPYGVTIVTTPPAAPAIVGVVGAAQGGNTAITADSTPLLFGTAAPYSRIALYNGLTSLGGTAADPNGHWDFTLSAGILSIFRTLSFTATATDVAGNVSGRSVPYNVTLLPSFLGSATLSSVSLATTGVLGVNPDGSIDTGATPTISGVATPLSQVAVFEDGVVIGVAAAGLTGNWSFTSPPLTTGRHRFTFEAANLLGVLSTVVDTLIIQV
jgi:hypothetical protein